MDRWEAAMLRWNTRWSGSQSCSKTCGTAQLRQGTRVTGESVTATAMLTIGWIGNIETSVSTQTGNPGIRIRDMGTAQSPKACECWGAILSENRWISECQGWNQDVKKKYWCTVGNGVGLFVLNALQVMTLWLSMGRPWFAAKACHAATSASLTIA